MPGNNIYKPANTLEKLSRDAIYCQAKPVRSFLQRAGHLAAGEVRILATQSDVVFTRLLEQKHKLSNYQYRSTDQVFYVNS